MEPNANRWILLEDLSEYSAENRELIEGTWHEGRIQMGEDATREASKNILKSMALQMEHSRADNDISNVFILQLLRLPARGSGQWLEGEPKDQILVDGIRNVHLDPPERWTMLCTNLRTNEKGLLPGKSFVFVGVNEMCDCGQNGGCGCVYEDLASSLQNQGSAQSPLPSEPEGIPKHVGTARPALPYMVISAGVSFYPRRP